MLDSGLVTPKPQNLEIYCGFDADPTGDAMAQAMIARHQLCNERALSEKIGTSSWIRLKNRVAPASTYLENPKTRNLERKIRSQGRCQVAQSV